MCFSAAASFTAAAILTAIGGVAVARVRRSNERPYALIPAIFGLQQLVEGGLWLTLHEAGHLSSALTHIYQFFSHVLWPIYVPFAVLILEKVGWRRQILGAFALIGAAAGLYLFYFLVVDPTTARISRGHIDYISPHFYVRVVLAGYVLATCASSLISSSSRVRWFGIATVGSLTAATLLYRTWFISVWCFFAAITSLVVLSYFLGRPAEEKFDDNQRHPTRTTV